MADSKIAKWVRWFDDAIFPEISATYLHRHAFRTVRDMVESNDKLPVSYFFEYIEDTYAITQSVAVRRQAECTSRVKTLGRLIREVEQDAQRLTRDSWIGLWSNDDAVRMGIADHGWTTQWAGDVGDHLDPAIPARDLARLTSGAEIVADYVDQYLAHSDARPSAGLPSFAELDAAIDLLGEALRQVRQSADRGGVSHPRASDSARLAGRVPATVDAAQLGAAQWRLDAGTGSAERQLHPRLWLV